MHCNYFQNLIHVEILCFFFFYSGNQGNTVYLLFHKRLLSESESAFIGFIQACFM